MKTPEERTEVLVEKIQRLIFSNVARHQSHVDFSKWDLTVDEAAGASHLMMPAVFWPKRWLTEAIRNAMAEARAEAIEEVHHDDARYLTTEDRVGT